MTIRRVGHLFPSGGVSDYELIQMAPAEVQFLTTRMPFRKTGLADDRALLHDVETPAQLLADAKVELIAFNCTAASLLAGDGVLEARITAVTGIPAVTTIAAVKSALAELQAQRIALFTPYPEEVVAAELIYLQAQGFSVVAQSHLPRHLPLDQGLIPPADWIDLVAATDLADAQAILFSCAGIVISPVIAQIEAMTGLPVVTSNQALLRLVLRHLGCDAPVLGFGDVLARPLSPKV